MQQAATRAERASLGAVDGNAPALTNAFVINLVSSTTPVALTRPDHAGLRRFNFFVSRRREQDGRERFRLHMGYFESQEEAEKLLDIVREIYPGAWAGMAPGRGLRTSAAPDAQSPAAGAATPPPIASAAVPSVARAGARVATVTAAAPVARAAVAPVVRVHHAPAPSPLRPESERHTAAGALGSVRAAIAAVDKTGPKADEVRSRPRSAATMPSAASIPTCLPAFSAPVSASVSAPASVAAHATVPTLRPAMPAASRSATAAPPSDETLSNTGALRVLEGSAPRTATRPQSSSRSRTPAPAHEKACYAVQLVWSVKPIDMTRVPQLAIFSAYTLYGAQGHRDGRRWYGLRLGFFTDAISAKQVAQYVRADFATVSVVPVTSRERDQAGRAVSGSAAGTAAPSAAANTPLPAQPPASSAARSGPAVSMDEFKLIDDAVSAPIKAPKQPRAAAQSAPRPKRGAPGKRVVVRRVGQVHAQRKVKPMTLEETLEILGANQLEVEGGAAAPQRSADEAGVRQVQLERIKGKPSKLSRLFDRLSERLG
jgi:hypothetical protein